VLCLWGREIGELGTTDSAPDMNFDCYASSFKAAISCLMSAHRDFNQQTVAGADAA
jgi:hypothetical protein